MYGLDVFVTGSLENMVCNVLVFPDKFLKKGADYSEEYWNIVGHQEVLIKTLNSFFKMIGVSIRYDIPLDRKKTDNIFNIKYVVSDDLGEYMNDYIKKYFELAPMFPKTDYLPEKYRQDINEPDYVFRKGNVYLVSGDEEDEKWIPHLSVDFNTNMSPELLDMLAHNETIYAQFIDFMSNNMELDPQIGFFKMITGGFVSLK